MNEIGRSRPLETLALPLDRDRFMRTLVRELANVLRDVVGVEQAAGFISVVGQTMGCQIDATYRAALGVPELSREQVAAVLVDLKQRIQGDFYVIAQDERRIVLGARSCPFAEQVVGQTTMCMMTSNVFGYIAAANLGYAKVELQQTIAGGADECRVVVHLAPDAETDAVTGREYFKTDVNDRS